MKIPKTIKDIQALIDNQVQESIHLDYKDSRALLGKPGEIAKDVSAFANSDGGIIVYGVSESGHLPEDIDSGIKNSDYNRERLEQVIQSNVSPQFDDLKIVQIELNKTHSIYVVHVSRSLRAPHQERQSKRYYKRYNFKSAPMEDYEINDIRNRITSYPPLLNLSLSVERGVFIEFVVENIGELSASDLTFDFSEEPTWDRGFPPQILNGIRHLQRGQKLSFFYNDVTSTFAEKSQVLKTFIAMVTYHHPLAGRRITDNFPLDISSLEGTSIVQSDLHRHGVKIEGAIKKLTTELTKVSKRLEKLNSIAGPTGLNLSVTSLRHVARILSSDEKLNGFNPENCDAGAFQEILGITLEEAFILYNHFTFKDSAEPLEVSDKLSAETIAKFKRLFVSEED